MIVPVTPPQLPLPIKPRKFLPLIFRGGKFMVVGWMGMLVNTGCLYLLKGVWGLKLIPASLLAIEIAILHNFIWFRHWAWKDRLKASPVGFFRQLLTFNAAIGVVDLAANVSVLWSLTTFFRIHYLLANLAGMIAGPFIKFWLNEKLIFREANHGAAK